MPTIAGISMPQGVVSEACLNPCKHDQQQKPTIWHRLGWEATVRTNTRTQPSMPACTHARSVTDGGEVWNVTGGMSMSRGADPNAYLSSCIACGVCQCVCMRAGMHACMHAREQALSRMAESA